MPEYQTTALSAGRCPDIEHTYSSNTSWEGDGEVSRLCSSSIRRRMLYAIRRQMPRHTRPHACQRRTHLNQYTGASVLEYYHHTNAFGYYINSIDIHTQRRTHQLQVIRASLSLSLSAVAFVSLSPPTGESA